MAQRPVEFMGSSRGSLASVVMNPLSLAPAPRPGNEISDLLKIFKESPIKFRYHEMAPRLSSDVSYHYRYV